MTRLHIFAEGQTEKRFVEELLVNHLFVFEVYVQVSTFTTKFDKQKGKKHKGGIGNYEKVRREINNLLRENTRECFRVTTMIDLYGIPTDFPGHREAFLKKDAYEKVDALENALAADIECSRFIPYVQLHEFEALLFSDPNKLKHLYFDNDRQIGDLVALSEKVNPELINDGPQTSPSKRIMAAISSYDKCFAGSSVAGAIGLNKIRNKCKHFDEWLCKLENLNKDVL
ncbi:MAG TPA: DUF4276 family protein [Candidatus Cloacimonetes bacterium]|nr:DUF4276 family protein [Candidatus Cloacimonadota bacterium]